MVRMLALVLPVFSAIGEEVPGIFEDCDGQECQPDIDWAEGLSFRQLRGDIVMGFAEGAEDHGDVTTSEEENQRPFCCFEGKDHADVCGTCYENAKAVQGKKFHNSEFCVQSGKSCEFCGGTWCVGSVTVKSAVEGESTDPEAKTADAADAEAASEPSDNDPFAVPLGVSASQEMGSAFCCLAAPFQDNFCDTCYGNAFVVQGAMLHGTDFCSKDMDGCQACNGQWCYGNVPVDNKKASASLLQGLGHPIN